MTLRHAGLRLGVVPGLDLLPVALLRIPPAALRLVHRQRACLVGEVGHVVYRLLHLALLQQKHSLGKCAIGITESYFRPPRRLSLRFGQAWGRSCAPLQDACQ